MITTDSCFYQGTTHHICQDFAASVPEKGIAAISDGCSSSPATDHGARALVNSALSLLSQPVGQNALTNSWSSVNALGDLRPGSDPFGDLVINGALNRIESWRGIPTSSLDATLGLLTTNNDDGFVLGQAFLWGDGVIIHRQARGVVTAFHQNYESGAPYYLSYRLNKSQIVNYEAKYNKDLVETVRRIDLVDTSRGASSMRSRHYSLARYVEIILEPGDTMMICTDGINTFVQNQEAIPWVDAITRICDFKSLTGEFIKKRMNFFGRENRKAGITHSDDFAIAAIHNDGQSEPTP